MKNSCLQTGALKNIQLTIVYHGTETETRRSTMEERLRKLEVALQHMELMLRLHKRSLDNNPKEYSDSFKHGQQLILDDVLPSLEEAKTEFNLIKEELLCQKN